MKFFGSEIPPSVILKPHPYSTKPIHPFPDMSCFSISSLHMHSFFSSFFLTVVKWPIQQFGQLIESNMAFLFLFNHHLYVIHNHIFTCTIILQRCNFQKGEHPRWLFCHAMKTYSEYKRCWIIQCEYRRFEEYAQLWVRRAMILST